MTKAPIQIGRYALYDELARGGMATVHLGRLLGPAGFARTVAIKRLHPHLATDPAFVAMLLDEARLAARIQHPNVAATIDVIAGGGELFVVMEYLHGETLSRLLRAAKARKQRVPLNVAVAIAVGALTGLHAAHEAHAETGELLGLVHRDVSPQNVMVRRDGTAVVVDFGVAKAAGRFHVTAEAQIKGKLPYMPEEQVRNQTLTRRVDVYAASAVLWEAIVGERLVAGTTESEVLEKVLFSTLPTLSSKIEDIPPVLDEIVMKGLARHADDRWATAREMALALEDAVAPATPSRVAAWMEELVGDILQERERRVSALESNSSVSFDPADLGDLAKTPPRQQGPADEAPTRVADGSPASLRATKPEAPAGAVDKISSVSSISSVAVSTPPRRARVGALVGIPVVAALVAAVALLQRGTSSPAAGRGAAGEPASPMASSEAPPSATVSSPPVASASDAPASEPAMSASTKPTSTATTKRPPSPAPKAAPKVDCSVPYVIDSTGRRIYRRECL